MHPRVPEGDARSLNAAGMALLNTDDARAADFFAAAIAVDPQSATLWINLATARRNAGDVQEERLALEGALALDQSHLMANVRLAEWYERAGDADRAGFRWGGVATILKSLPDRNPSLDDLAARAATFLSTHTAATADRIDTALFPARAALAPPALRRFDACVDAMLGRRAIYAPEPHGLHFPFLPADEFLPRGHFDWLPALEAQTATITAELLALLAQDEAGFAPYVELTPGSPANIWTPLDGSPSWSARYLWRYGQRQEDVCAQCPATAGILDTLPLFDLPGRSPNVFFSILTPGTALPPHTGVSNVRCTLHLPLIVPEGCGFRVGGTVRPWVIGEGFVFDDTIEHEAWNRGGTFRAVLIADVWNPHLTLDEQTLLRRLYEVMGPQDGLAGKVSDSVD